MKRDERYRQAEMLSTGSEEVVRAAREFILARDPDAPGDGAGAGPEPFPRDARSARTTADAIMIRVRRESSGKRPLWPVPARHRAPGMRIAMLAAAAVLVAALSSIITLLVIGASDTVEVHFVLAAPEATTVMLAADFNQWKPDGYAMKRGADGHWEITVPLRKGKSYAYNFVIDGERWIADPASASRLDDGFGGSSSTISL